MAIKDGRYKPYHFYNWCIYIYQYREHFSHNIHNIFSDTQMLYICNLWSADSFQYQPCLRKLWYFFWGFPLQPFLSHTIAQVYCDNYHHLQFCCIHTLVRMWLYSLDICSKASNTCCSCICNLNIEFLQKQALQSIIPKS